MHRQRDVNRDPFQSQQAHHHQPHSSAIPNSKSKRQRNRKQKQSRSESSLQNDKRPIIELRSVSLKKCMCCPRPVLLRAKDGMHYIVFFTDYFTDRKCIAYDIEREHYFELCEYPDLRFTKPIYAASPNGCNVYIYDGDHQSFAMMDIAIDRNDACHHPKVTNIRKTKRKTEKLRNIIKTGKGTLCLYLPEPWDEFHIIGGSINTLHLKWCRHKKQFLKVSESGNINTSSNGIVADSLFFSFKFKQFIMMGGGTGNDSDCIWNLSYPSTESKGFWWIKSLSKMPYLEMSGFGSVLFDDQYILLFGGMALKPQKVQKSGRKKQSEKSDEIFILDIDRNEWRKSQCLCPVAGTFHAVYTEKYRKIHLFAIERTVKDGALKHWAMDLDAILKHTAVWHRPEVEEEAMNHGDDAYDGLGATPKAYDDFDDNINDEDIRNGEQMDDDFKGHPLHKSGDSVIMKETSGDQHEMVHHAVGRMQRDIVDLRGEVMLIWDFMTQLKNDMQIIKEYQLEIIKNVEQNSLQIIANHKMINEQVARKKERKKRKKKELSMERGYRMKGGDVDIDYLRDRRRDRLQIDEEEEEEKDMERIVDRIENDDDDGNKEEEEVKTEMKQSMRSEHRDGIGKRLKLKASKSKPEYSIFESSDDEEAEPGSTRNSNRNLGTLVNDVDYDSVEIEGDEHEDAAMQQAVIAAQSGSMNTGNRMQFEEDREQQTAGGDVIGLQEWLTMNRLDEYHDCFVGKGYRTLDSLLHLDDNALLNTLGITKVVHRRKLLAKLKVYANSQKQQQ